MLSLLVITIVYGCGGNSKPISLEDIQQRRDNLYYFNNSNDLASGRIVKTDVIQNGFGTKFNRVVSYQISDGKVDGVSITTLNNQIVKEINYENGIVSGKVKKYSRKGDILVEGQCKDGKRIGEWKTYDDDGLFRDLVFSSNDSYTAKGKMIDNDDKEMVVDFVFQDGKITKGINYWGNKRAVGDTERDQIKYPSLFHAVPNIDFIYTCGHLKFNRVY